MRRTGALVLGCLGLVASACSAFSSGKPLPPATTHPLGSTLAAIEQFFSKHGVPPARWAQGPNDSTAGALDGMDSFDGGAGHLSIDVIGNPADETQVLLNYAIVTAGDAGRANALVLAVVQHFAPGAVAWIRGGLDADDGANGYFAGAGSDDTSGTTALSFSTDEGKDKGLSLVIAGGKIAQT